ncbi:MAG: hypothetical protein ACMV0J_05650 [Fluviibacter sp.]|jgi:hypothetical protein
MNEHTTAPAQALNLTPALQLVDYWAELAAIASYTWFNSAMIFAAGVTKAQ